MMDHLWIALKITGQGLLGIFVSILLVMLITTMISKLPSNDKKNTDTNTN